MKKTFKPKTPRDIPHQEVEAYADKHELNIETEGNFDDARQALFNELTKPKPLSYSAILKKLQKAKTFIDVVKLQDAIIEFPGSAKQNSYLIEAYNRKARRMRNKKQ